MQNAAASSAKAESLTYPGPHQPVTHLKLVRMRQHSPQEGQILMSDLVHSSPAGLISEHRARRVATDCADAHGYDPSEIVWE